MGPRKRDPSGRRRTDACVRRTNARVVGRRPHSSWGGFVESNARWSRVISVGCHACGGWSVRLQLNTCRRQQLRIWRMGIQCRDASIRESSPIYCSGSHPG